MKNILSKIYSILKKEWLIFLVIGFLIGILLRSLLDQIAITPVDLFNNLAANAIDIAISVLFVDRLIKIRDERQNQKTLQSDLIKKLGSDTHTTALAACEEIRQKGWFKDGTLFKVDLTSANLSEGNLSEAVMEEADFMGADLRNVNLMVSILRRSNLKMANLQGASLVGADLSNSIAQKTGFQEANLSKANMRNANLSFSNFENAILDNSILENAILINSNLRGALLNGANLRNANLTGANLSNAKLKGATLEGAIIKDAIFDKGTRLPDGSRFESGTDLESYISPASHARRNHDSPQDKVNKSEGR